METTLILIAGILTVLIIILFFILCSDIGHIKNSLNIIVNIQKQKEIGKNYSLKRTRCKSCKKYHYGDVCPFCDGKTTNKKNEMTWL